MGSNDQADMCMGEQIAFNGLPILSRGGWVRGPVDILQSFLRDSQPWAVLSPVLQTSVHHWGTRIDVMLCQVGQTFEGCPNTLSGKRFEKRATTLPKYQEEYISIDV